MIEKTDAIILKSKKYRDTSKIITLYTKDHGKLNMIAKGSRAKNSKFGGSLETLSHISIVFYNYPQKDFQYITQSSINNYFHRINDDIYKTMTGMAISEIVNNTTHPNYKNEAIFDLLLSTFTALNDSDKEYINYLIYFQIHYAELIGFSPNFSSCAYCGLKIETGYEYDSIYFNFESGSIICGNCYSKIIVPLKKSSPKAGIIIQKLLESNPQEIGNIEISSSLANEIFSIFHIYLKSHVTGMKDLKSLDLLFSISDE